MSDPGLAALLSFLVPGLGQIYNGEFFRALFWLVVTPGLWILTGGVPGAVCHLASAYTAFRRARRVSGTSGPAFEPGGEA